MSLRIGRAARTAAACLVWLACVVLLACAVSVAAGSGAALAGASAGRGLESLPHTWCGIFRWSSDNQIQHVSLRFEQSRTAPDGRVELVGSGVYSTDRRVVITVRAVVDPNDRSIEIWESNPSAAGFTTEGSHVGRLTPDLQTIRARWRPRGAGPSGALVLHAAGPLADPRVCDEAPATRAP